MTRNLRITDEAYAALWAAKHEAEGAAGHEISFSTFQLMLVACWYSSLIRGDTYASGGAFDRA